jgi:hypothetical protein
MAVVVGRSTGSLEGASMHRLAIIGLAFGIAAIGIAMFAPASEVWRITAIGATVIAVAVFIGLLAYRILRQEKGENIVADIVSGADE